jgi:serine/threonine protein kinase
LKNFQIQIFRTKHFWVSKILNVCWFLRQNMIKLILVLDFGLGPHPGPRTNLFFFFGGGESGNHINWTSLGFIWRCPYGKAVDIWAIGCIVCEMTSGRPIYEGKSDLDQLQKIKNSLGSIAAYQMDELQRASKQPNIKVNIKVSIILVVANRNPNL